MGREVRCPSHTQIDIASTGFNERVMPSDGIRIEDDFKRKFKK